ncbi:hypothetical protein DHODJN_25970 [Methylorubrum extorquens]
MWKAPWGAIEPKFGKIPSDRTDELGALAEQYIAGPEDYRGRLLRLALLGYEVHGRLLHGLAGRLGIGRIVLPSFDEGFGVARCDQTHRMAETADLATAVMRTRASLHRHEAGRLGSEEGQHLITPQLLTRDRSAAGICAVRLEDVLGQIQADGANLCHGRLRLVALNTTTLARRCRRGRPPHHWKTTIVTAALRLSGIAAPFVLDGPINRDAFQAHVGRLLVPELTRGDIV